MDYQRIVQHLSLVNENDLFEIKILFLFICIDIEPRQLEPVEFIVSGSATGAHNILEQYPTSSTSNFTTKQRTVTSRENLSYNDQMRHIESSQNYAPYFINSLRDKTVREGEPVLFEIIVSGKVRIC